MQRTNTLYVALIILIGIAAGYLYYSQWIKPTETSTPPPVISANDDLTKFKDFKIDFAIFDNPAYQKLSVFGEMPVSPGVTGKKDLFAP